MKIYKRTCRKCGISFQPNGIRHFYCGNAKSKTGCSWKREQEISRKWNINNNFRYQFILAKGKKCEKCGIENENLSFFDVDHITPLKRKSLYPSVRYQEKDKHNFQVLCPNCHRLKTIANKEF